MNSTASNDDGKVERVAVTVLVAQRSMTEFDDVVRRCKRAGLQVTRELRLSGVISGTIAPAKIMALEGVEGVDAVERERTYQHPPRDSDVQ